MNNVCQRQDDCLMLRAYAGKIPHIGKNGVTLY